MSGISLVVVVVVAYNWLVVTRATKFIMKTWLLPLVLSSCEAAGMTAHNVAARRASQFEYFGPKTDEFNPDVFYHLAEDRSDAIQAGSPFPDYLYACGDEHDAGEEAHWTPFQIAAVNYIRDTYPDWQTQDRKEDGPGLVAFTMVIVLLTCLTVRTSSYFVRKHN